MWHWNLCITHTHICRRCKDHSLPFIALPKSSLYSYHMLSSCNKVPAYIYTLYDCNRIILLQIPNYFKIHLLNPVLIDHSFNPPYNSPTPVQGSNVIISVLTITSQCWLHDTSNNPAVIVCVTEHCVYGINVTLWEGEIQTEPARFKLRKGGLELEKNKKFLCSEKFFS